MTGAPTGTRRQRRAARAARGALAAALLGAAALLLGVACAVGAGAQGVQVTPGQTTRVVSLPAGEVTNATRPLRVVLSGAPDPQGRWASLSPQVAGTWSAQGDAMVFTPASTLAPCSQYTLVVWPGADAIGEHPLTRAVVRHLSVSCPPVAGLQEALARLGYLGARFRARYIFHERAGRIARRTAAVDAYHPPRGALLPSPAGAPAAQLGVLDATTRGALMVYQLDRGLEATGVADEATWERLLYDLTNYRRDPRPYTWVTVSEGSPEILEVHLGSHVAVRSLTNTGVPGAETQQGIFPIYARYVSTAMIGTDPDGESYDDPAVPWVNYFNGGDAVHGYPRASYGWPQSNGCVELPIGVAQTVYGFLSVGDIVEVR